MWDGWRLLLNGGSSDNANHARGIEGAIKILAFSTAVSNQNNVSINAVVCEVESWWEIFEPARSTDKAEKTGKLI
jgi:hypothetical protein